MEPGQLAQHNFRAGSCCQPYHYYYLYGGWQRWYLHQYGGHDGICRRLRFRICIAYQHNNLQRPIGSAQCAWWLYLYMDSFQRS